MKSYLIGLALLFFPIFGAAQDSDVQHLDNGLKKMMTAGDTMFAMKAAEAGLAEERMGKLAAEKASDPGVKAFGRQMVDDHGNANAQLKEVAAKENMTLPRTMSSKEQTMYDKLQTLSGAAFDKAYISAMVKDYEEDVKEFRKEATRGKDDRIKSFASQTLPLLQEHLDKIKAIQAKTRGI